MSIKRCVGKDPDGLPCQYGSISWTSNLCGLHTDIEQLPEVLTEVLWLLNWARHASIGDGGEEARVEFMYKSGDWFVDAHSFYDGHAEAVSGGLDMATNKFRDGTLLSTLKEVRERLTTHPERQQETEFQRLALDIAVATDLSKDQALAFLKEHTRK